MICTRKGNPFDRNTTDWHRNAMKGHRTGMSTIRTTDNPLWSNNLIKNIRVTNRTRKTS